MVVLDPYHLYSLNNECTCKMCRHQPPSLTDSARHVLFNDTLHIDRFKLTVEKTYHQYVYAVRSKRVMQVKLVPPEAPTVHLWFRYNINSPFKYHRDYPGVGPSDSQSERTYESTDAMIKELITHKEHFWCHHCEKGLFFPNSCTEHTEEKGEVEE